MSPTALRILRIPLTVAVVWAILAVAVPVAVSHYAPYLVRPGIRCIRTAVVVRTDQLIPPGACQGLADLYRVPFVELLVDSLFRSLALLVGAAVLALTIGTLLGAAAALMRRRAWGSGAILGVTTL